MKKITYILSFFMLFTASLFALKYTNNFAEQDFYSARFDKIIRFDTIYFSNSLADKNLSKKLKPIIQKIKEELATPQADVKISLVGYSGHRKSSKEALKASKMFIQKVLKRLVVAGITKSKIYTYAQGDKSLLYSDTSEASNRLSNRVNVNLYLSYLNDNDKDGVYSDKDKCPYTPLGVIVNKNGCRAKSVVILIKGHKKNTKIIVSNKAGSVVVDTFNTATLLNSSKSAPTQPEKIAQKKIDKIFGDLESVKVVYKHYIFYFQDMNLLESSKQELLAMMKEIKKIKNPIIKIIGHTDTVGSDNYNFHLGLKRAQKIKAMILKSNVKALKIDTLSYGENNLAVKTADNVDEKLNRRVEVFIH